MGSWVRCLNLFDRAWLAPRQVDSEFFGGAEDVVGLDREQLLQRVRRAVGLHGPALHFAEALATELGLSAQWLLSDHRVRAGRASVNLVVDQVQQLEDVDVPDAHRLRERLSRPTVEQPGLAGSSDQLLAVPSGMGRRQQAG